MLTFGFIVTGLVILGFSMGALLKSLSLPEEEE